VVLKHFRRAGLTNYVKRPVCRLWQRNYYEHVVRGENELHRIREYIANNPLQWEMDRENPLRIADRSRQKAEPWEV
jgi:putative transposase